MARMPACGTWRAAAIFAAALMTFPGVVLAHDPGLSALDVRIETDRIVATLALAASDARATIGPDSIEVRIDDVRLQAVVEHRDLDEKNGARLVLAFERGRGSRLAIRSLVPGQLAAGHRELITIRSSDGRVLGERMFDARESELAIDLGAVSSAQPAAFEFARLGVEHILGGYDHLLFLAALLLGVRGLRSVVATVTAFTAAHSLTLAAAALGVLELPPSIVEPAIAASIVYVGLENLLRGTIDSRWKLTFAFGLIHGFGFAGALRELGLGTAATEMVTALGSFNAGVEIGQLAVVMLLWPVLQFVNTRPAMRLRVAPICSIAIVAAGSYWLALRTL
jgi:hydrogenase/urease accessory protein HupE